MPVASRRRSLRRTTLWCAFAVVASCGGARATLCSQSQQGELSSLVEANKALFQACASDLKLATASSSSADALASFITEDYLQDANADLICASDNCVKALIQAMENLPDCCSQTASVTRNVPRLADDILHQCDVRDAKQLATELEAAIAKLPDLKVQIKSLGTSKNGSSSGSGDVGTVGDSVDVIIDVKKRELMKLGGLGLTPNSSGSSNGNVVASSTSAAPALVATGASLLIAAVCTTVQLLL